MSSAHRSRARRFALVVLGAAVLSAAAAPAQAATYTLQPDSTVSNTSWTVTPSGSAFAVLDDAVLQPTLPSTSTDYLTSTTSGASAEVTVGNQALAAGDSVTSVKAWVAIQTGSKRSATLTLLTGSTTLATATVPAATATSWQVATSTSALTQAQLDNLRVRVGQTTSGSGATSASFVYATYIEVNTAGILTASTSATPSFSATLDGTNQTRSYDVPLTVADTRNTSSGWNLTISATQFATGGGSTLPTNASTITAVSAACAVSPCVGPTNSLSYPIAITAGGPAVKFFNAASSTGTGQFTITPTTSVSVPANATAGTYTSTLTYTVASGP